LAPHAPYTVADDNLVKIKSIAEEHDLLIHVHLHETAHEVEHSINGVSDSLYTHRSEQRTSPVHNFNRLGLLSPRLLAVHMTALTDDEIKVLQETETNIVHW
jgi:5-methylthioadenosine/S-adenosylhomocysteine deaminase